MAIVSPKLAEGELVNIHIRGARFAADHGDSGFDLPGPEQDRIWLPLADRSITVERVAPAEWPPQPGDIWADGNSHEWIAVEFDGAIKMRTIDDDRGASIGTDYFMTSYGPVRLLRRRGWEPTPPAAEPEPGQVDRRAELVAGLRELADLVESRTDLGALEHVEISAHAEGPDAIAEFARILATEPTARVNEDTGNVHHGANGRLHGLPVRFWWIDPVVPVLADDVDDPAEDGPVCAEGDGECEDCADLRFEAEGMPEPCQPIGCDNGHHLPGCWYAEVDAPAEQWPSPSGERTEVEA